MKSDQTSRLKKWGKKLVRGVKNFWIFSISISAFICTKNYQKIFKTRECTSIRANVYICAKSGKKKSSSFKNRLQNQMFQCHEDKCPSHFCLLWTLKLYQQTVLFLPIYCFLKSPNIWYRELLLSSIEIREFLKWK